MIRIIQRTLICWLLCVNVTSAQELVIATTLSSEATEHIISQWQKQPLATQIRTLNRTSASIERLLENPLGENIDLVLSSSPMLLQRLQSKNLLQPFNNQIETSRKLVPDSIRSTTVAVAVSGYGILINVAHLEDKNEPVPTSWKELSRSRYQGTLLMSSPSRSDTTHLMIEDLLQQQGWNNGWSTLLKIGGNLATISSRSFGVANKISTGLGDAGPIIDNYANVLLNNSTLRFSYFPNSRAAPMFIAITNGSEHSQEAGRFINFLLSPEGQQALSDSDSGKYPVYPLPSGTPLAEQQLRLFSSPSLDYPLIMQRQKLVQLLFDNAITFRLTELQNTWKSLYAAEHRLKRKLPDVRTLLTAVPVTPQQAINSMYLQQFELQSGFREAQIMAWQQFFLHQQQLVNMQLESLK
ncbi:MULTISPECIES: ABC transporter substrate-binding protein [Escherichia]|uniref:ABC transporter substrate-binding protein n=1 Tax=Escherichia marmotae TaxID=1499973 RepID=A0A7L6L350_9ESCH|nr:MULTISPECIES: ABC transporter substrate-binding protein [Escherichia]MEC9604082.1 ABC transporter substrate-binding protein [Escherichia marmotae]MED0231985.1 ABC transporter substrate-binding protein [Escherichia marmotae]MED0539931.1 ABC transporter substrate-binding protein [Escherichia marmotae]MED8761794.1 ABC transporter substrate-binding protein [Escherichia marmotae]MED8801816.1 ABC transporter substrate-binding protein [Escherichia marmotae]